MKITLAFQHTDPKDETFLGKIMSFLIKKWTKSKYFHVECIIDDIWVSMKPGTTLEFNKLKELNSLYDYVDINIDGRKNHKVLNFLHSKQGEKYDWFGIVFSQIIDINLDDRDKWYCSELITQVLRLYEYKKFKDLKDNLLSPEEVYQLLK